MLCAHCGEEAKKMLCQECLACMELLEPTEETIEGLYRASAAFEYEGPIVSLVQEFKYGRRTELAKSLAGYLYLHWVRLEWPEPDLIVPVPQSFWHGLERGYNQSLLLAKALGNLMSCAVEDPLLRKMGGFSQNGLSKEQRLELSKEEFDWKNYIRVADKTLLLIDDVMTTGATLRACALRLLEGFPARIYALTLCL